MLPGKVSPFPDHNLGPDIFPWSVYKMLLAVRPCGLFAPLGYLAPSPFGNLLKNPAPVVQRQAQGTRKEGMHTGPRSMMQHSYWRFLAIFVIKILYWYGILPNNIKLKEKKWD
jgi:hypothetical protein